MGIQIRQTDDLSQSYYTAFSAAIAQVIKEEIEKKGGPLKVKDLYAMNFNPVLSQEDFQAYLKAQDDYSQLMQQINQSISDEVNN